MTARSPLQRGTSKSGQPVQDGIRSPRERAYDRELAHSDARAQKYDRDDCTVVETYMRALDEASVPSPVSDADSATRLFPSSLVATAADPKSHRVLANHEETAA